MNSEVKKGLLLGLFLLTALSFAWSLFFTDENMQKLTEARDGKDLSKVVIIKQINSPLLPWAKDPSKRGLRVVTLSPPQGPPKMARPPPPRLPGNPGHTPLP
ncbi:hypothetical protein CMV_015443 [Castanea mollissima]|uniref:Uncharacterized protein n=1 Tax=Castanea mollissima TaxID=60419 RepID=A0A8J4VTC5_9ROSI|nr:hypothetical protein CMV_015443 [Castanea mollissima]